MARKVLLARLVTVAARGRRTGDRGHAPGVLAAGVIGVQGVETQSSSLNLRMRTLYSEPKNSAMMVLVSVITLYGMLKSGVGNVMSRLSV